MSMWLDVVVMNEAAFKACKADEGVLGDVFQQETKVLKKLGIATSDLAGCDYRSMDAAIEMMNEDTDEEGDTDFKEEGNLEYEGTYGRRAPRRSSCRDRVIMRFARDAYSSSRSNRANTRRDRSRQ